MMKITYDLEADALYIALRDAPSEDSIDIEEGVTADLDAEGHIIGLEPLDARERLGTVGLSSVSFDILLPDVTASGAPAAG
jgi:uncharacterized protein YuzE